jgi:HD-GYP domain-containing protein (c-di-GMP phosphodiesterase class II)
MLGTITRGLNFSQRRQLENSGERLKKFGVNFAVCDVDGELVLLSEAGIFKSSPERLIEYSRQVLSQQSNGSSADGAVTPVWRFGDSNPVLAAVLKSPSRPGNQSEAIAVALIDTGDKQSLQAGSAGADSTRVDVEYLSEMLELFAENFQAVIKAEEQIEKVGTELSQTYEELVLLHKLSTNMKVTEQDTSFLQMACDNLTAIVSVEGIAILVEKLVDNESQQLAVAAGSGLIEIDERMAAILHSRLTEQINNGKEALLDSEVDAPFKYDWPDNVKNIIAVPLFGKEKSEQHFASRTKDGNYIIGLLVAINRIDKPDFDSTDIKLFSSVAGSCAVFIENGRLFTDLKELFIGSLKALTSSIDAKDQYTRGHSDRVAFISRWIAERLAPEELEEEQIHRIYLAGLLHDIGKIGIDEAVLRKNGKLTEQELDRVRKHPSIGAGILSAIKQMRDIVPAVLCHHERVDGKGYPAGLVGNQVPLTGKIVGLADSFDAMTSKRTYRDARTVEEALVEIEKGIGTQFDEKVARAFLNSDVYHLWDTIRDGFCEINGGSSFAEYGTAAVGTLIG